MDFRVKLKQHDKNVNKLHIIENCIEANNCKFIRIVNLFEKWHCMYWKLDYRLKIQKFSCYSFVYLFEAPSNGARAMHASTVVVELF